MRIHGFHPVHESLRRHPEAVEQVWVARSRGGRRRREIEQLCRDSGVRLVDLPDGELDALAEGVHNGFLAELRQGAPAGRAAEQGADPELVVIAEDVQDPRNLGALIRVCEGAGAGRLLIRDRGSAPLSAAARKASAGAAEYLPVERIGNTARTIAELKERGFWIYGLAAGGRSPWEIDLTGKLALIIGGEEKGLRRLTRERCDGLIGLPMRGEVSSLNLATAAAAVLYDAVRQRCDVL